MHDNVHYFKNRLHGYMGALSSLVDNSHLSGRIQVVPSEIEGTTLTLTSLDSIFKDERMHETSSEQIQ
jgi:hypothetical protein